VRSVSVEVRWMTSGNCEGKRREWEGSLKREIEGEIVKRNVLLLGMATLACAAVIVAQDPPAKKSASNGGSKGSSAAAARGKDVFEKKCAICHYPDSDAKKIGPGLKGLAKRGTFSVNNNKVTDENLRTWIENGDSLMPPFKDVLEAAQIKDVIAYVKTL
jgi:mono/diheme cytochrome c family protein